MHGKTGGKVVPRNGRMKRMYALAGEASVVETRRYPYAQLTRLIKRPAPGAESPLSAQAARGGPRAKSNPDALKRLEGRPLIELFHNADIVEIVVPGDLTDRDIYDVLHASAIAADNLSMRYHIRPSADFTINAASGRFFVSLFHGAPIGHVRTEHASGFWFWRKQLAQ